MTLDVLLIATGALGVLVAALSARIRRLPVSEPLLALVVGVLVGPQVLRALPLPPITTEHSSVHDATRILLVISVMGVALRYPFGSVRAQLRPVSILLGLTLLLAYWELARQLPGALWWQSFFAPNLDDVSQAVVHFSWLPRLAVTLLAGAALGLAGTLMQQVLRNPRKHYLMPI